MSMNGKGLTMKTTFKTLRQWIESKYGRGVVTDIRKLPRQTQRYLRSQWQEEGNA